MKVERVPWAEGKKHLTQVSDAGLPDRCRLPAAAVGRPRAHPENLAALRARAYRPAHVHLQRHVEAILAYCR